MGVVPNCPKIINVNSKWEEMGFIPRHNSYNMPYSQLSGYVEINNPIKNNKMGIELLPLIQNPITTPIVNYDVLKYMDEDQRNCKLAIFRIVEISKIFTL